MFRSLINFFVLNLKVIISGLRYVYFKSDSDSFDVGITHHSNALTYLQW